jgi:hypothetical protein
MIVLNENKDLYTNSLEKSFKFFEAVKAKTKVFLSR